jgi:CheY-like chemotaxis protein/HPt (histidine-containing phosphotransfer) domain-containing protein
MSRDPSSGGLLGSRSRGPSKATVLHALEWGAAIAFASLGTPANLEWRMVACGLVAVMSIQRVRQALAAPAVPATIAARTDTAMPASVAPAHVAPTHVAPARAAVEPRTERSPLDAAKSGVLARAAPVVMSVRNAGAVLLAEDEPSSQLLIATQLRHLGYTVTIAGNGRAAVDLAISAARAGDGFDIVLMDMQMPEMDGYTAATELRARGYKGSIVALTANAMDGDRARCLDAGCDEYLTKPVNRPKLLHAIRESVTAARIAIENADTCSRRFTLPDSAEPLVSDLAGDADMADLIAGFVRILSARASALTDALAKNDRETLKRVVHQLKGAAGGYGFSSITEQAKNVEQALALAGDGTQLKTAVESLCSLCHRAGFRVESTTRAAG